MPGVMSPWVQVPLPLCWKGKGIDLFVVKG